MTSVVVDTDVVSLIFKRHSLADVYLDALDGKQLVVSFMTLAELSLWARRRSWGPERRERLSRFLNTFAVCHSDDSLCDVWSAIRDKVFRAGLAIDVADPWIAATAVLSRRVRIQRDQVNQWWEIG